MRTVRDTHDAWAERVHTVRCAVHAAARRASRAGPPRHRRECVRRAGRRPPGGSRPVSGHSPSSASGPRLEDTRRGRVVNAAVNGIIGDRLARERPRLAVPLAVRRDGRDVPLRTDALPVGVPGGDRAGGRPPARAVGERVVLRPAPRRAWARRTPTRWPTWAGPRSSCGPTPASPLRENGVALSALLAGADRGLARPGRPAGAGRPLDGRADRPRRLRRAASADEPSVGRPGHRRGHPRHAAPRRPARRRGRRGRAGPGRLPETAAFGRILDQRSAGVLDLVEGLADDVPPLPHARYHLVSATLTRSPRHPVGRCLGDLLVRQPSAYGASPGRSQGHHGLFPGRRRAAPARAPGTSTCSTIPGCTRRCATGWPEERPSQGKSAVGEQGPSTRGSVGRSG